MADQKPDLQSLQPREAPFRFDVLECRVPMTTEQSVMIQMRDGTRIAADVFRPAGPGPFPTLYAVSPYNKATVGLPPHGVFRWREAGNIGRWVEQGYAFVHADTRGTGQSEGEWRAGGEEEQCDLYDTIEWIARQPWSTGKVGMIGESYYAYPQWLAAAQNPPHLACIAPYDGLVDSYRDSVFHGGIFGAGFVAWWSTNTRALTLLERDPGEHPNGGGADIAGDFMRHPLYDDYWKTRSASDKFGRITTPFYSIANWTAVGIHLRGNLLAFEEIDAPKKLLVAGGDNHHASIEIYHAEDVQAELTRWYDHWLKGVDTGIMDEPPKYWMGNEGWRTSQTWPLPGVHYVPIYLSGEKAGACESLNDGTLTWTAPAAQAPTRFDYPQRAWGGWPGFGTAAPNSRGMMDNAVAINTFTSQPLDEDVELAGPIVLRLWLSSTAQAADVIAKLYEVPASPGPGPLRPLTRGWLKASHRATDPERSRPWRPFHPHDRREPLRAGETYRLEVEIWPAAHKFSKGSRIRLDLANGDSPVFDMPFNHHYGCKLGTDWYHHDPEHPSQLLLPLVPRTEI